MLDEAIDYLKMLQAQLQVMSSQAGMAVPSSLVLPASSAFHATHATDYAGLAAADLLHSVLPPSRLHTHADSDSLLTAIPTRPSPHCLPQRPPTHPSSSVLPPPNVWPHAPSASAAPAMAGNGPQDRRHQQPPLLTRAVGGSTSRWPFDVDRAAHDSTISTAIPSTRTCVPSTTQDYGSATVLPVRSRVKSEGLEQARDVFAYMAVSAMTEQELQQRRRSSDGSADLTGAIRRAHPSSSTSLSPEAAAVAAAATAASMSVPCRSLPALSVAGAHLSGRALDVGSMTGARPASPSKVDLLAQLQAARAWKSLRPGAGEEVRGLEEEEAALRMMMALEGGDGGAWFDMCGREKDGSTHGGPSHTSAGHAMARQQQQQLLQQRQLMIQKCQEEEHYMRQLMQYKPYEQQVSIWWHVPVNAFLWVQYEHVFLTCAGVSLAAHSCRNTRLTRIIVEFLTNARTVVQKHHCPRYWSLQHS